jgi:hypothetical protein
MNELTKEIANIEKIRKKSTIVIVESKNCGKFSHQLIKSFLSIRNQSIKGVKNLKFYQDDNFESDKEFLEEKKEDIFLFHRKISSSSFGIEISENEEEFNIITKDNRKDYLQMIGKEPHFSTS